MYLWLKQPWGSALFLNETALMGKYSYKLKFKDFVIFLSSYPNKFQSYQKLQQQTAAENEAETADILQNDSFAQVNIK